MGRSTFKYLLPTLHAPLGLFQRVKTREQGKKGHKRKNWFTWMDTLADVERIHIF